MVLWGASISQTRPDKVCGLSWVYNSQWVVHHNGWLINGIQPSSVACGCVTWWTGNRTSSRAPCYSAGRNRIVNRYSVVNRYSITTVIQWSTGYSMATLRCIAWGKEVWSFIRILNSFAGHSDFVKQFFNDSICIALIKASSSDIINV